MSVQTLAEGRAPMDAFIEAMSLPSNAVNTDQLRGLIEAGGGVVLLDARPDPFYDGRRLPGALRAPPTLALGELLQRLPDPDTPMVVYCARPCHFAALALGSLLRRCGYEHVVEYIDGIETWIRLGGPVEYDKPSPPAEDGNGR